MSEQKLAVVEARFADIIWENAPLRTAELVRLCQAAFGWKRTTTYTVLKRLCDRGFFRNADGTVEVLLPKEDYCAICTEHFVAEHFDGSLPAFLAAFTARKSLSEAELQELQAMIDRAREGA